MNLSATQKQSLREARTRLRAGSELARQQRTELVQQLTSRMVDDDSWTMERLSMVSSILSGFVRPFCKHQPARGEQAAGACSLQLLRSRAFDTNSSWWTRHNVNVSLQHDESPVLCQRWRRSFEPDKASVAVGH